MKRFVAFVAIGAVALVLVAMPAFAITGVNGTASTDNTILSVKVGTTLVRLGTDTAESLNTSTRKAIGKFLTGQIGAVKVGSAVEKTATNSSDSGTATIGSGITQTIPGLASLVLQGGTVSASVASTKVNSAVHFALGNVDALAGFATIGTTNSSTDSTVGKTSSLVSRDISIGKVGLLDLRSLLGRLGINPLALTCNAVQSTGAQLAVATSTACSALSSVGTAITGGATSINATETALGVLNLALAPICAAAPAGTCTTVTSQIATLQSTIAAFQANPSTACATLNSALATVTSQANTVVTTLNGLSGGALPDISALIAPVTSQISGISPTSLSSATATLNGACSTLAGIVNGLLDTQLLSLDLIKVAMNLAAKPNPAAAATGTIGALKVGNVTVVSANDLVALAATLNGAVDTVKAKLGTVLNATGLGLAAPSLDLLKVVTSKGKKADGSYFAQGAMTVAHLGIPSASVQLPVSDPLGVLNGFGSFAPASVHLAAVTTPAVAVDAGVFSGTATFKASGNAGGRLPVTGMSDSGLVLAGMLTLIGAALFRRVTRFN